MSMRTGFLYQLAGSTHVRWNCVGDRVGDRMGESCGGAYGRATATMDEGGFENILSLTFVKYKRGYRYS